MSDDDLPEHDHFKRLLGASYEPFCEALAVAAQLFARSDVPSLAFRVDGAKRVVIIIKRGT